MKKLLILMVLISSQAFAADLSLNGGESATIQANVNTYVTCGGSSNGDKCGAVVQGFKVLMEACQKSYGGGYCAEKYWPSFKAANLGCAYAGVALCIEACQKSYGGGYCAEKCQ